MARTKAAEMAREVTRKELLRAALQVFVEKGYPVATISDIVHAAGVTQGTFYLYFENKREIFSGLLQQNRELTVSGVFNVDLQSVRTKSDWMKLADRISEFLLEHLKTHGDFMRLFLAESATIGSDFLDEANAFSAAITQEISRLLRHGIEKKLVRKIDVEAVSVSLFGALKEAINQSYFEKGPWTPEDIIPRVIRSQAELLLK